MEGEHTHLSLLQIRCYKEPNYSHTFTNTPKKSSLLSSWTLLDAVFLSLQCEACFWTSAAVRLKLGPHSAGKTGKMRKRG